LVDLIDKTFGSGSIRVGRGTIVDVSSFSTGIASIDVALGCGGIPQGRIIELYGPESSGKTTTTLQIISACQKNYFENKKRNGVAAFIDAEHALDPVWAENIGVDMDKLMLSQPDSGEQAITIVEMLVKSGLIDIVIVDSVAALIPQCELDGEIGDHHVGAHARLMSKAMRMLKGIIHSSNTTVIFINQIREKIGVMFGSPEVTPGGRALKFYASIRADVRRGTTYKDGDDVTGFRTSIKIVKNKVAPPFTKAEFDICVGHPARPIYGIDDVASLIDVAQEHKIIDRSGSWYNYGKKKLGNGLAAASAMLQQNPDMVKEIRDKTYGIALGKKEAIPDSPSEGTISDELDQLDNDLLDGDDDGD